MKYKVIVGNIGTVYDGKRKSIASEIYKEYVEQSKTRGMRASGEPVTLLENGEITKEHEGNGCPPVKNSDAICKHACSVCGMFWSTKEDAGECHSDE